jgi:hypothetical protein
MEFAGIFTETLIPASRVFFLPAPALLLRNRMNFDVWSEHPSSGS